MGSGVAPPKAPKSASVGRIPEERLRSQSDEPAPSAPEGAQRFDLDVIRQAQAVPLAERAPFGGHARTTRNRRRDRPPRGRGRKYYKRGPHKPFYVDEEGNEMDAQAYLGSGKYRWLRKLKGGPRRWLDEESRIKCFGWSLTMILKYGQTWNEGFPDIKPNGMVDIRELLAYEVVKAYNTTIDDLEQVLEESVETERDGTLKYRFDCLRDSEGNLTDMSIVQGHSDEVQACLAENHYMTEAYWGDNLMTEYFLHGTKKEYVSNIRKNGLKAGGGRTDRAFIFLVPERENSFDHPLLRHGTECVVKVFSRFYMSAGGKGWWTKNDTFQTLGIDYNIDSGIPPEFIADV